MNNTQPTANYNYNNLDSLDEVTNVYLADGYDNISISLTPNGTTDCTITAYGSMQSQDNRPDATAPVSDTNKYFPLNLVNLTTNANINGENGVVINTTATENIQVEANQTALTWVFVKVTAYTAGSVDAQITLTNNN